MIDDVPFHTPPDAGFVCQALAAVTGRRYRPTQVAIEAREDRWLVRLPDHRLAWLARSALGLERLRREGRVLRLIEQRCSFEAPRVLFESFDGDLDVDMRDFGTFQACYTPTAQLVSGPCTACDLNHDNVVDQSDLALFLRCLNGADQPPACN